MEDKRFITPYNDIQNVSGFTDYKTYRLLAFVVGGIALIILYLIKPLMSWKFFIPLYLVIMIWWYLVTIGDQGRKIKEWEARKKKPYINPADITTIESVLPNGCVSYQDNTCSYFMVFTFKETVDEVVYFNNLASLLNSILTKYAINIYLLNRPESTSRYGEYDLSVFKTQESKDVFVNIINATEDFTERACKSLMAVVEVKHRMSKYLALRNFLESKLTCDESKVFQEIHIADRREVEKIISLINNTKIDLSKITNEVVVKNDFGKSEILSFDEVTEKPVNTKEGELLYEGFNYWISSGNTREQ